MATSGMNLNSLGLNSSTASSGSGIDVTAVVNQILDSERGPENIMKQQQASLQTQASALSSINSGLSALLDKVNALKDPLGALVQNVAISSQPSILTATAQTSVAAGTHVIVVNNLSSTGTAYSDPVSDANTAFGTGVITLTVGGASHDIQVNSSSNTLTTLVKAINQQNLGVTASVINDASGARLALVSNTTGAAGDLGITANTSGLSMHKGAPGQNASVTIDGLPFSSATNTVTGVIPGVTFNLVSAALNTEVQVNVGPDHAAATQAVQDFVSAYNSAIRAVNSQFQFDTSSNQAGVLATDSSVRTLQSILLNDATYSATGNNGLVNLASLGVNMANDGTLSVDTSKLNDVLTNNFSGFQNFFQAPSTGYAQHVGADLNSLTNPTQGILNVDLTQNTSLQKSLTSQIADFEDRLAVRQQQLITQYSQVDTLLRQFPLLMAQINGQLGSLPTTSK
jgi:flagellar hook-associated protein 2